MDVPIRAEFQRILEAGDWTGSRVMEIGATLEDTLLTLPQLRNAHCLDGIDKQVFGRVDGGIVIHKGNSHRLPHPDSYYDLVLCSDMLEHDERFWLSISEMWRILKQGGLMVIAVPGFAPLDDDGNDDTRTYKYHPAPGDYYRFSEAAVREVFFHEFENVEVNTILFNHVPRIVAHGVKP